MNFVASDLKELNRQAVYELLRTEGEISKAQLSRMSGISAPTVIKIIDYFMSLSLVLAAGEGEAPLGRKPHLLCYNPTVAYAVGVEYDGLDLVAGLVDLAGTVGTLKRARVEPNIRDILGVDLVRAVASLINNSGIDRSRIKGLGLGLPGVLDADSKSLRFAPLVGVDAPLDLAPYLKAVENELGLPVSIENDANAAATGELAARQGCRDLLYVELGRGIGAGLILDGKLRKGPNAFAGEIGYLVFDGAYEASIRNPGWLESKLDLSGASNESSTGGTLSRSTKDRVIALLAPAIANAGVLLDLDTVVLGGSALGAFGGDFASALERRVADLSVVGIRCEPARSTEPGIRGAAGLAIDAWLKTVFAG